jgi:predicted helicase
VASGMWSPYIEQDLIPRLHGFELLMASYAMCHMKLDMILTELGYKPTGTPPRLGVYLTNSLEEGERDVRDLFMAQWLTREAREANTIKRQTPIMCVIGNPPYSGESANKGDWIMGLMEAYKKEPGGKEKLKERNPKWINDDYVKFIRFAEHLIEKTGEGVLGFITNHGYLDNPTFRGMRWNLLETFDKIYVLDLHGNSNKREVNPTSEADKNVFDILTGVSIIVAIKKRAGKNPKSLATLLHQDFWGSRTGKYKKLEVSSVSGESWKEIPPRHPQFHFVPRNFALEVSYESGFSIGSLFLVNSNGIVTGKDGILIAQDRELLRTQVWNHFNEWQDQFVQPLSYRMFGSSYLYNDPRKVERSRSEVMSHYLRGDNLGLLVSKQVRDQSFAHCFVTQMQSEAIFLSGTTATNAMNAPLYLYPTEQDLDQSRRINFDPKLYARLQALAQHPSHGTPDEVAVFDYVYGVLHCPAYRQTYAEFLKLAFPRIPWPATPDEFWDVSIKGTQLRKLHLMDPATIGPTPYTFKGEGNAVVDKPRFEDGKVWINATQYFDAAPEVSWTFYIGGYQPAQKWLKDRKGRALSFDDAKHYQRILKILSETDRIMQTISMTLEAS